MIPALGNISLWLSLVFAIIQFANSYKKNNHYALKFNSIAAKGLLGCILVSFFSLIYSHIVSDFSVLNVFQNSHTTKPFLYKISGVWGNHEGSMLLWILVLTIFNYFIFKLYNRSNFNFVSKALETQALITIGFILFTLLTSNPFERMSDTQINGLGFNPILQDPALAIHPPLLYIGYVGFSAAFSISVATLSLGNDNKIPWYSYMKPFVLAAWAFLSIGIALGATSGVTFTVSMIVWADYYGRGSIGAIRGLTAPIQMTTNALGPLVAALTFDLTGSYGLIFWAFVIICFGSSGLWLLATRPEKVSNIRY